jgi:hypothetical protein
VSHGRKLLGRGTVLVDPRAAVAKLRSYQLGEPVLYVLELVRAAVAGGATAIDLENDADDFALTFDGDPLDADDLSRLLDFLLSGANPRLRLVAVAVNTALGFSPAHIDLYTTRFAGAPADGSVVARVRWGAGAPRDGGVDQGVIERVARPAKMPSPGMRIHVREAFGVAVMREWFRAEPAETDLLRERVVALPVPLTRNGVALAPREARPPVASVPLALSGDLRGALHLVDAQHPWANTLVYCERGVALEVVALREPDAARTQLPLRMIVDADALPTNAARSKVTLSAGLRGAARRAWQEGVAALVEAAVALAAGGDDAGLRAAEALAALVRAEAGDAWHTDAPSRPADDDARVGPVADATLARLLDAPIVPTATGTLASLRDVAAWSPRYVWRDDRPLAPDLARWVRNVVWSRDDRPALAALLHALPMEPASVAVQRAQEAQARHARFLGQPVGEPVTAVRDAALRRPFGDATGPRGELAVAPRGLLRPGEMKLTPWVERRPLGAESAGAAQVGCEVALEAPGLRILPGFEGVARDDSFTAAVACARAALVEGLAALVAAWGSALPPGDPRGRWVGPAARDLDGYVRARVARAVLAEARAMAPEDERREALAALLRAHPALADAPAWSTTVDDRFVSTRAVIALAERAPGALLVATPSSEGGHPAGVPVLTPDADDRATLAALCPPKTHLVDYGPYLSPPTRRRVLDALSDPSLADALAWVTVAGDGARMAVAPAPQAGRGALTLVHAGRSLGSRAHATPFGHALVVLEDDGLTPDPSGNGALAGALSREAQRLLDRAGVELARALADALNGARDAPATPDDEARHVPTLRFLLAALAAIKRTPEHQALGEAIARAPLVPVYDATGQVRRTSVDALVCRLGEGRGALPVLRQAPANVDGEGFEPIILPSQDLVEALSRATGLALADASAQLPHRKGERARRIARAALDARPKATLDALGELGAAGPIAVASEPAGSIAVAPAASADGARVQCLIDGVITVERAPARVRYPLVARVALSSERLLRTSLDALTPTGEQAVERLVEVGALALAARLATAAHAGDVGDAARAFLVAWVGHRGRRGLNEDPALRDALARAPLWRSPAGGLVDLASRAAPIACVRGAPGGWLSPAEGEPADPDYVCVVDEAWVRCLAAISAGAARDVTQAALTAQRARRLRARGAASVRLDGDAPVAALAGRVEALAPSLGFGELRVVDGPPGIAVSLFVDGACAHRASLRAPFAVEVALASPAIDPARVSESFQQLDALPALLAAVRALAERAAVAPQASRPWVRRVVRWWLLTTPGLGDAERALAAFVDSAGRAVSLDDLAAQRDRFDAVAYATEEPAEPCEPLDEGRRVVMLQPEEARWLGERWGALNYTATLHEDADARRWEREAPREKITVDAPLPSGARRVPLRGDALEGEVALVPPGVEGEGALVQWFMRRRPLGTATVDAPWHCLVAVEARGLTPNRRRSAPVEGDGYRRACEAVTRAVLLALDDALPAPEGALATAAAHAPRSPATTRATARIAGSLWLSLDDREGSLDVLSAAGRERIRGDARRATPVHGALWVRRAVRDAEREALLAKTVEWAWRAMLESVVSRARRDAAFADDARVVDHLVAAALGGALNTPKLRAWARLATLPGTSITYERVAATERSPLALVGPDAAPDGDALAEVDAPWFARLTAARRVVARRASVAPAAPATPATPATPSPRRPRAPAAPEPSVAQGIRWPAGALLQSILDDARAQGLPAAAVTPSHEPVSARRPTVRYDASARTLTVFRAHPAVVALDGGEALRGARFLALAAFGAIRRAVGAVTDAHEAGLVERLLSQASKDGAKRPR